MNTSKYIRMAALATAISLPGVALAQSQAPAADQAKVQALAQEYQAAAQKLAGIREATYDANPELAEQRDAFQAMIEARMAENGFDADGKLDEMQAIADQLKSEDIDEARKQELVGEFQKSRQSLLSAQRDALSEPDVQQAGEKLQKDTLAAMRDQNAETAELLERLGRLRADIQSAAKPG